MGLLLFIEVGFGLRQRDLIYPSAFGNRHSEVYGGSLIKRTWRTGMLLIKGCCFVNDKKS